MPVKVGVVGLGTWGCNVARTLFELPDCDLVVCSDEAAERREMAERCWGTRSVATMEDMLRLHPKITAMVISSPAATHYPLAKLALLAGKDVFVEKPFTLNVVHAEELQALALKQKKILMVGHVLEYHPAVNYMRDVIRSGELGDIYYIYTQRVNPGGGGRDENALWNFAPHDIAQVLYLLGGNPMDVSARGQSVAQCDADDVIFLSLFFSHRVMAHIHISSLNPQRVRSTTVVGSKKMIVFDDVVTSDKVRIYDSSAKQQRGCWYGKAVQMRFGDIQTPIISDAEPLKLEMQHFLDCVRDRVQPRSDAKDGTRVTRILEAAQRSMESDGVPVPLRRPTEQAVSSVNTTALPVPVPMRSWSAPQPAIH